MMIITVIMRMKNKNICDKIEQEDSIEEFSVLLSYVVAITEIVLCSFDPIQITHFLNMVFNHHIMTSISSILTNATVHQSNRTNKSNNKNILEDIQYSSLLYLITYVTQSFTEYSFDISQKNVLESGKLSNDVRF